MRIDRALANSGLGSRKEIRLLLKSGRVHLTGQPVTDPGLQLTDEQLDLLTLDGEPLHIKTHLYFLLNKPQGYLTAMSDTKQAHVGELVPEYFGPKKVVPVGRLDKDTTGLLLFTNDGLLHHRLLSPTYEVVRGYLVEVTLLEDGQPFSERDRQQTEAGLPLNETETARPAKLKKLSDLVCELELTEGRYHEVKRMMHALGKEVRTLHRLSYGTLTLADEKDGELRELTATEISNLRELVGL